MIQLSQILLKASTEINVNRIGSTEFLLRHSERRSSKIS